MLQEDFGAMHVEVMDRDLLGGAVSLDELMQIVPGPDFPTGGIIMGRRGILQAYATGRGLVRVRARCHVEDVRTKQQIVVTEVPFQVRKTAIIEKIVDGQPD